MTILLSVAPIIPARDLTATTSWYRDALGFTVRHVENEYGIVERDAVEIHFWGPSGIAPEDSLTMYRIRVRGIDPLYLASKEAGIVHPNAPLDRKPWGTTEFGVRDCDGNLLTFFETRA